MRIFLAPIAEAGQPIDGPVTLSWEQQLSGAGFDVTKRHYNWLRNGLDYVAGHSALVLPSTEFGNGAKAPVGMSFDTVLAIKAAIDKGIPIFSERPIAVSFAPLAKAYEEEPLINDFGKVVDYELGETIIGHDIGIMQRELGGN